ncbi:hypothetical protein F4802DRAFT_559321 [Xylaria palmicola]|nr:hypothetical protein F4802DRAFT_559321 [Xylaria palmicola]
MASLTHLDAPGAYPATPSNEEEPAARGYSNNNRAEPSGPRSNLQQDTKQNTHPSGHSFAGSGIHVDEPSLTYNSGILGFANQNTSQQPQFSHETPRSFTHEAAQPTGHHNSTDSGLGLDDSLSRADKPGLMTGAYSRVGTRDSAFTQQGNYTHGNESSAQPAYGVDSQRQRDRAPANVAPGLVTPANSPADPKHVGFGNEDTATSHADQRNRTQSGLRGVSSSTKNEEPYWGDIPFGAGVYNGVTGHGSDESTSHRSCHDKHDTAAAANSGVYNGVTGHGSEETTNPTTSHRDQQDTIAGGSPRHQRAFPLNNNDADPTTTSDLRETGQHGRDSRLKEGLAGAGAGAAGGFAAHKYLHKDSGNEKGTKPTETFRDEKSSTFSQNKPASHSYARHHHHHGEGEQLTSARGEGGQQSLPYRPVAAAAAADASQAQNDTTTGRRQNLAGETARENWNKDEGRGDSNFGYYGAAAAAGAGAGAYGMHKYARRDGAAEENDGMTAPAAATPQGRGGVRSRDGGQLMGDDDATRQTQTTGSSKPPRYSMLPDGTPSGIAVGDAGNNTAATHASRRSYAASSDYGSRNSREGRSSTGSSSHGSGGRYNVLSSGTPSGVNLDQAEQEKLEHREQYRREQQREQQQQREQRQQEQQTAAMMPDVLPSSSSSSSSRAARTGVGAAAGAATLGAGSRYAAHERGVNAPERNDLTGQNALMGGGSVGGGSALPSAGRKVTHRCTKCGEENDISGYLTGMRG